MAARITANICEKFQSAADLLGKRWTALIVQSLGAGAMRYSQLVDRLDVVSERMLTERLKELEARGVVDRHVLTGQPVRVEYALTEKGRALSRVISGLERWADQWIETP